MTKQLPACAGRILDVILQVLKYCIFCDGTIGGRKVTPAPKPLPPITFLQCREFPLYQIRGAPFHFTHEVADRKLRRDRDKHVDVITRHNTTDNRNAIFRANPADDLANPTLDVATKHLETVLRRPHHMIAMVENAMFAFVISHDHTLQKNEP